MPVREVEAMQGMHFYDKNNIAVLRNKDWEEKEKAI